VLAPGDADPMPTDPPALRNELIAARPASVVGGSGGAGAENIQKSCTRERLPDTLK
jgi:hypothetical protein